MFKSAAQLKAVGSGIAEFACLMDGMMGTWHICTFYGGTDLVGSWCRL